MRMIFVTAGVLALVSAGAALADVALPTDGFLNATGSISLDGGPHLAGAPGFFFWNGQVEQQSYETHAGFGASGEELSSQVRADWTSGDGGSVRFDGKIIVPNVLAQSIDATFADLPVWTYEFSTLGDATFDMHSIISLTGDFAGQGKWDLLLSDDLGGSTTFHLSPGLNGPGRTFDGHTLFDLSGGRDYAVSLISLDHVTAKNQTLSTFSNFIWRIDERAAAGVPEPATWAMLLAGFGGIGGVLRRRHRPMRAGSAV